MVDATERRAAVEAVNAYFRPGIEIDEEQATVLQVERVRLTLYGSLATIAGTLTALMATEKAVNQWTVGVGLLLMFSAAAISWVGLTHAQTFRYQRGTRRLLERQQALSARFGDEDPVYTPVPTAQLAQAWADEQGTRDRIANATLWSSLCIMFGGCALLMSALQAVDLPAAAPIASARQEPASGH